MADLTIQLAAPRTPLVGQAVTLLQRRARQPGTVELALEPGPGVEGCRVASAGPHQTRITGHDERGLLYGVGKFLRDPAWRGASVPAKPVRGMYFATHFHNFYHDAPLPEVIRYIEDLALWGCNALTVWFDLHHYSGLDDPRAQAMIARLTALLRAANAVGMGAGLLCLANEAYATSPPELRAEPFPHHYKVEVCPSRPGGLDLILRWRREMLAAFAALDIEYVWIWPYDQGGCKCAACAPWGSNGFLRTAAPVAQLVRETFPRAKTILSTWEFGYWFGETEWEQCYAALAGRPDWVDMVMAEHHGDYPRYVLDHGAPGGLPLLNFPEISMSGMYPWGGFGANLQPQRLENVWRAAGHLLAGGFPYSEGIFEDLNKVICLQLNWTPDRPVRDIVREYAAAEFAPAVAELVTDAVYRLEQNMHHAVDPKSDPPYRLPRVSDADTPCRLLEQAAGHLSEPGRAHWRWRLLWLRAALDRELTRSGGRPTDASDAWFAELSAISHAAHADWAVQVPSRSSMRRFLGGAPAGWQQQPVATP